MKGAGRHLKSQIEACLCIGQELICTLVALYSFCFLSLPRRVTWLTMSVSVEEKMEAFFQSPLFMP